MALRVHSTILKKRNKKGLLKKVVDYLKSDSYMFAPLISSPTFDFSSPTTSSTGVETEKPIEEKNKKLLKKVGDYLKSDCYMYAPLLVPQSSVSATTRRVSPNKDHDAHEVGPLAGKNIDQPQGATWYLKRVSTAISAGKVTKKKNQPIKQTANVIGEAQSLGGYPLERNNIVRRTTTHKEMVKHMVHQNCRPSSVPGKGIIEKEQRKVLVE
ncbi:uncharacterized protein LOC132279569 isoform X1 [Cornus florida]|uniref:uncharacterized protein LOC132279569 isoform X1 n=1 Tax=Cornus florida TaxID=4283 RepID=UPI0028A21DBB|nr:uncharacterized protein LOC132279569 isoform X1 [Cornus florida]